MRLFTGLFFLLVFTGINVLAQSATPNIGFEDGTFNHWQCYGGYVDHDGTITVYPGAPIPYRHTILGPESAKTLDPYGNFPVLCPNGSKYSIRLGNSDNGAQAERVTYTLTVPQTGNYGIVFDYAVVLENPPHESYQQPRFTLKVFDSTDNKYLECPYFDFISSPTLPGFKYNEKELVYYKDWSSATVDLSGFSGKIVRLEFTTNDCTQGAHFGYAYLDINENTLSPITGNSYCVGQKSVTLYAPNGFATYNWYDAAFKKQLGQEKNLTLSPPPPSGSKYAVVLTQNYGLGCPDTLFTTITKNDEGFKLNVLDTVYGCPETGANLTAAGVTNGSSEGMTFTYFTDSLAANYLPNPNAVTTTGLFYIQGVNARGCTSILPVQVLIGVPPIIVTDPAAVTFPSTVDLANTYTHHPGITYTYYADAGTTTPVKNYETVKTSGAYYVKGENSYGCDNVAPIKVVINPPAPYTVTAPTAFTPNNDGVNDHFIVTLAGIASFQSVRIFNRYGQLVFTAKSPGEFWDGNFNGQKLPTGTYYWVFEGMDDYYNRKINKAAYITLLR